MPDDDLTPTDAERANGWTLPALRQYLAERARAQSGVILFDPKFRRVPRPRWANRAYDPQRFGR